MTDENFKILAAMVLAHDERLDVQQASTFELHKSIRLLIELAPTAVAGKLGPSRISILESWIDQQEAIARDAKTFRDDFRKKIGLV